MTLTDILLAQASRIAAPYRRSDPSQQTAASYHGQSCFPCGRYGQSGQRSQEMTELAKIDMTQRKDVYEAVYG